MNRRIASNEVITIASFKDAIQTPEKIPEKIVPMQFVARNDNPGFP